MVWQLGAAAFSDVRRDLTGYRPFLIAAGIWCLPYTYWVNWNDIKTWYPARWRAFVRELRTPEEQARAEYMAEIHLTRLE